MPPCEVFRTCRSDRCPWSGQEQWDNTIARFLEAAIEAVLANITALLADAAAEQRGQQTLEATATTALLLILLLFLVLHRWRLLVVSTLRWRPTVSLGCTC